MVPMQRWRAAGRIARKGAKLAWRWRPKTQARLLSLLSSCHCCTCRQRQHNPIHYCRYGYPLLVPGEDRAPPSSSEPGPETARPPSDRSPALTQPSVLFRLLQEGAQEPWEGENPGVEAMRERELNKTPGLAAKYAQDRGEEGDDGGVAYRFIEDFSLQTLDVSP
jgi:hypothetical protein